MASFDISKISKEQKCQKVSKKMFSLLSNKFDPKSFHSHKGAVTFSWTTWSRMVLRRMALLMKLSRMFNLLLYQRTNTWFWVESIGTSLKRHKIKIMNKKWRKHFYIGKSTTRSQTTLIFLPLVHNKQKCF